MTPFIFTKFWPQVIFYSAIALWAIFEFSLVLRDIGKTNSRNDNRSAWTISLCIFVGLFSAYEMAFWFPELRIQRNGWVLLVIGVFLILLGLLLRYWAVRTLGKFFRRVVMTQENHRIITKGPYRFLRHPSYSAILLVLLGISVALGNWLSVLCAVGISFLGLYRRMMIEEDFLQHHFGETYTRYARRTKRLIPFIW